MLDIGVGIIEHLTAVINDDGWDYDLEIELLFSLKDVRYFAQSVRVSVNMFAERMVVDESSGMTLREKVREITSVVLRQVKVAEAVRVAASGGIFLKLPWEDVPLSLQDLYGTMGEEHWVEIVGEQITSRGPTDQNLRLIGDSYMIAQLSGEAPAKAVERIYSLPARTASNWIARAREAGFIRKPKVVTDVEYP